MASPFTSEWEWNSISRDQDTAYNEGSYVARNNWVMTRSRVSDEAFDSELGNLSGELEAYNGGVTEVVTAPTSEVLTFDNFGVANGGTVNWTLATTNWIWTGDYWNGEKTYAQVNATNIPNGARINLVYATFYNSGSGSHKEWACNETTDGTVNTVIGNGVISLTNTDVADPWPNLDTVELAFAYNAFTGKATANVNQVGSLDFYCSSDNQVYNDKGVDWYTQVQTWIYKDSYE